MTTIDWSGQKSEPMTAWKNPTRDTIRVPLMVPCEEPKDHIDEHTGELRRWTITQKEITVEWQPGEEKEIPSRYDLAIHDCRECSDTRCRRVGRCLDPMHHAGVTILGGSAPLLVRAGQPYGLHPSLLPSRVVAKPPVMPSELAGAIDRAQAEGAADGDPAVAREVQRRRART